MFHVEHMADTAAPIAVGVSRETEMRLEDYAALLRRWNGRTNLIAAADLPHIWQRHIADALQLIPLIDTSVERGIDLGSGAGIPGLVLALARPLRMELVEAQHRKAAFLREASRLLGADVVVHPTRIETLHLEPAKLVTARALAPLPQLLAWTAPLLSPGGYCLFPKGESAAAEIAEARKTWHIQLDIIPSTTRAEASILRIADPRRV